MILINKTISIQTLIFILLGILVLCGVHYAFAADNRSSKTKQIDFETGIVVSGYNDVQIPKMTGTRISFTEQLKTTPQGFFRIRLSYIVENKHTLSFLFAPLRLNAKGVVNYPIRFEDTLFPANINLNGVYRFNSYRLTYRYNLLNQERFILGLGLTAKIRDAEISLEGNGIKSKKTNVGFVPLINFNTQWKLHEAFDLVLEGDALVGPQGRAEDIALSGQYNLNNSLKLKIGYRFLEGGADVDEVYNFAWLNYGLVGIVLKI